MADQVELALTATPQDLVAAFSLEENTSYTVQVFVFGDDLVHIMQHADSPGRGSTRGFQYEHRELVEIEPTGAPIWAWNPGATGRGRIELVEAQ